MSPFGSKSRSEPVRRRIDMAVAVAEEKLLATHIDRALGMVERVGGDVPFDDVLDIYTRLLRLSTDEGRVLKTRAMAVLGQREGEDRAWPDAFDVEEEPAPEADDGEDASHSLLARVRQRFRGRINEDLRFVIELEAARAEEALLYRHVANGLQFIALLDDEMSPPEVIDLYIDALEVRESLSEVVYHVTLSRLADKHFRDEPDRDPSSREDEDASGPASGETLQVVERDGG